LDVSLALCRTVDRISLAICADPVPLLSLEFGWLHGVNDRVSSGKDGYEVKCDLSGELVFVFIGMLAASSSRHV